MTLAHLSKGLYRFQPLDDPRWRTFLQRHPRSSVFHTVEWLDALRRSYGYEPIAITTCPPTADLRNAVVFCHVNSWLTGRRLVSLPFSDHCEPLVDTTTDMEAIIENVETEIGRQELRYAEIRPMHATGSVTGGYHGTRSYCLHLTDIRPDLDELFRKFHKDSIQRKIRRAEREGLTYEDGRSASLLNVFYGLMLLTRRRHGVPPQPIGWFQALIDCFGQALKIRVVFKSKQPVAAVLTLRYKDTVVYKYGCSDTEFHNLGGMHLLLWRTIREAKEDGLCVLDLGRSDWEDRGLITFKDRWGSKQSTLTYLRFFAPTEVRRTMMATDAEWNRRTAKKVFRCLPDWTLRSVGDLLYRHFG